MGRKKLYATCPWCGARLFKLTPGSEVEAHCSKCGTDLLVKVNENGNYTVELLKEEDPSKSA